MSLCESLSSIAAVKPTDVAISAPALNRRAIRQIINRALGSPAELDSFLIDYFPEIYRLTSDAMNRDVKLNLLLWNTEEEELRSQVEQSFPQHVKEVRTLLAEQATSTELPGDDTRKRFVVILSATIEEADRHQVVALLRHMRLYTSDAELTIEAVQSGSVILICSATDEAFHKLFEEFVVGHLPKLLHFSIRDIYPAHLPQWRKRPAASELATSELAKRREQEWAVASRSRPTEHDPERNAQTLRIERASPWLLYAVISFLVTVGIGLLLLSLVLPRAFWQEPGWSASSMLGVIDLGSEQAAHPRPPVRVESSDSVAPAPRDLAAASDDEPLHSTEPSALSVPSPSRESAARFAKSAASALEPEPESEPALEPEPEPEPAPSPPKSSKRRAGIKTISKAPESKEAFQISAFCGPSIECQNSQISVWVKKCLTDVQPDDIKLRAEEPTILKKIGDRYFPYNHYADDGIRARMQKICTCVQEQLADNQPDMTRWPVHIWILPGS